MKNNNLLILCHELMPVGGGAGNFSHYLADGLSNSGAFSNIIIVTSNYENRYKFISREKNILIYRLPILRRHIDRTSSLNLILYTFLAFGLAAYLNFKYRFKFNLAIHGIPAGWVALPMRILQGLPYGLCLRGGDVPGFLPEKYDRFHKRLLPLTKYSWKKAQFVTFNAVDTYGLAKEIISDVNTETHIIPNGVDQNFFRPGLKEQDTINIVFSGRLTEQKNPSALIDALKEVLGKLQEAPNIKVKIAGSGNLMRGLRAKVLEEELSEHVDFLGWLRKEDLKNLYASSHIFVLPSLYEGMSNSLLEALSCGLAVICSDFEGCRQIVRDGENGYLVRRGSIEALVEKLQLLVKNADLIDRMGSRSREIALNFGWEPVTERYIELICKRR